MSRALRMNDDTVSHAAIDFLCALMEPMHEDCDLRQEQLNKTSLLSSEKFLDGLLDLWSSHVVRGTGALVVAAMLDFLTFALCAPYRYGNVFLTPFRRYSARALHQVSF